MLGFRSRHKLSPAVQISQRSLYHYYKDCAKKGSVPSLKDTGFKVFSQFEEDGILLFLFAVLGETNKTFVDIGSNDGVNSNCTNLAVHFGWRGLFIDGDEHCIERGKRFYNKYPNPWNYKPKFSLAKVKRENINDIIKKQGFEGEIDLLSIDIDGNDYWIWDALTIVQPRVVIIETHIEFGMNNIVVPYDANYVYPGKHPAYHGASPVAMEKLAKKKGYRLVGSNNYGHNLIFVKNGLGENLVPAVTVESTLQHPWATESFKKFEEIKDWKYENG